MATVSSALRLPVEILHNVVNILAQQALDLKQKLEAPGRNHPDEENEELNRSSLQDDVCCDDTSYVN